MVEDVDSRRQRGCAEISSSGSTVRKRVSRMTMLTERSLFVEDVLERTTVYVRTNAFIQ